MADLLSRSRRLCWSAMRSLDPGQHRPGPGASLDQNRKSNRRKHKEDGGPGGHFGQQVGCATRPERRLRALATEGAGEVCALTLLEKYNANQDEANNNVNRTHKPDHENLNRWCGRGDLNPHASRRHPLKMVCLPISPLPRSEANPADGVHHEDGRNKPSV